MSTWCPEPYAINIVSDNKWLSDFLHRYVYTSNDIIHDSGDYHSHELCKCHRKSCTSILLIHCFGRPRYYLCIRCVEVINKLQSSAKAVVYTALKIIGQQL